MRRLGVCAMASIAFFGVTAFFANRKLFWFDELFTVFIARQPDTAHFLAALTDGGDTLPPGIHLLTRGAVALFGDHHLSIRLPAILGYWVMLGGIYAFVRRRGSRFSAWTSVAVPLASNTYWYAFEARPYGLLAGASAVALLCWQRAGGEARRLRWLIALAIAVFAALMLHWYAVLLIAVLLVAEAVRWVEEGEIRIGVPVAVGVSVLAAAPILYPFFIHGIRFKGLIDSPDALTYLFHAYDLLLGGVAPFLLALLLVAAATGPAMTHVHRRIPASELVVAIAFSLLPGLAFTLATITNSQLLPRYTVSGIIGCALLLGFVGERVVAGQRLKMLAWSAVLALAVSSNLVIQKLRLPDRRVVNAALQDFSLLDLAARESAPDLLVPDGLAFIRLAYYAPPDTASRLRHIENPSNLGSHALSELARHASLRVEPVKSIGGDNRWMAIYDVGFESPLLAALAKTWTVEVEPSASASSSRTSAYWQLQRLRVSPASPSEEPR